MAIGDGSGDPFLMTPEGILLSQFGGGLLKGFAQHLTGGARRRRIREAERFSDELGLKELGDMDVDMAVRERQGETRAAAAKAAKAAASRVGLGSGLGQAHVLSALVDKDSEIRGEERRRKDVFNMNLFQMQSGLKKFLAGLA